MKLSPLKIISKILSFSLLMGLEFWILFEAYQLHSTGIVDDYTIDQLFWLFILLMITPVLPQITFYLNNKTGTVALHITVILVSMFLILLDPLFIPTLPILEVLAILLYAYVTTGVSYLNHRDNLSTQAKTEVAYTTVRIIAFFVSVYIGLYFGNQDSFTANYLLYILITIPLFLFFAVSIFINSELGVRIDKHKGQ
jgi:hypothetical protein